MFDLGLDSVQSLQYQTLSALTPRLPIGREHELP